MGLPRIAVKREDPANFLRSHGEDDLAERSLTIPAEELNRIGILAAHYAFSDVAMKHGGSMGRARTFSLATVDVLEGTGRDLRQARHQAELNWGWPEELAEHESERIRVVRLTAPR